MLLGLAVGHKYGNRDPFNGWLANHVFVVPVVGLRHPQFPALPLDAASLGVYVIWLLFVFLGVERATLAAASRC